MKICALGFQVFTTLKKIKQEVSGKELPWHVRAVEEEGTYFCFLQKDALRDPLLSNC